MIEFGRSWSMLRSFATALCIAVTSNPVLAETERFCTSPDWFKAEYRTHSPIENLDLSEPVLMRVRDVPFLVPHGYNGYRFKLEHLERFNVSEETTVWKTRLSQNRAKFLAWMPSMEWPRFRTTAPVWRDCSDQSKHLIRFWILNPFLGESVFMETLTEEEIIARNGAPNPERWYSYPDRQWQNRIVFFQEYRAKTLNDPSSLYPELSDDEVIDRFGRTREELFQQVTEPFVETESYGLRLVYRETTRAHKNGHVFFSQTDADNRQIFIFCPSDANVLPYPFCRSFFYWPESGLGIQIDFQKTNLPDWDAIAEGVNALITSWHEDATNFEVQ